MPYRILIADDHHGIRQRVRSDLEAAGFEICGEAVNGLEAVTKAKALLPDLIILNLSMPVMNGFDAIPLIVRSAPGAKIIIFSVEEDEELRQEAFRRGAHGYVRKSSPANLISEVTRLLGIH